MTAGVPARARARAAASDFLRVRVIEFMWCWAGLAWYDQAWRPCLSEARAGSEHPLGRRRRRAEPVPQVTLSLPSAHSRRGSAGWSEAADQTPAERTKS